MNKKLIIVVIVVSILALIISVILLRSQTQEANNISNNQETKYIGNQGTTSQTPLGQTTNQYAITTDARKIYSTDKTTVIPDLTNQVLNVRTASQAIILKLGNYPVPRPNLVLSPSGHIAAAIFPVPTTADSAWLVLGDEESPATVHSSIENIAGITNDGRIIYHAEDTRGNVIAIGKPDRADERILAQVTDQYIGFATLDINTYLYWGQPTAPGEASNLYMLKIDTGQSTTIIDDHSIVDATLSPSKKQMIIARQQGDKITAWLYSLQKTRFIRDLKADILLSPIAWNSDESAVVGLSQNQVFVLRLSDGQITNVSALSLLDASIIPALYWKNDREIEVYIPPTNE